MRIQHNIMAMGAYRNYTNNVNAMKKNLEKLSSGYKINRAGDDAAGLAISEKMRAQITGLETAQKNAKDGISLVQTAEGALTEVHDMLNRMVTLATQSANGTYDNDVDRVQLQKELDQLRTEINRIADSANFNGIKLFDGSLSGADITTTGIETSQIDMAKGIEVIQGGNGGGTNGVFTLNIGEVFGDGDELEIQLGGNLATYDSTTPALTGGNGKITLTFGNGNDFTGATREEQAASIRDALSKYTAIGDNFEIGGEGTAITLTSKTEGNDPTKVATVVGTTVLDTAAKRDDTNSKQNTVTAGTGKAVTFKNPFAADDGSKTELHGGDKLQLTFNLGNGITKTATLTITDNMLNGKDHKEITAAVVDAMKDLRFDDDPKTASDESLKKLSDYFTIATDGTNKMDIKFDPKSGVDTSTLASIEIKNLATNKTTGAVNVDTGTTAATANVKYEFKLASGGTAAAAPADPGTATNLSNGDKLTIKGSLADGRQFSFTMEAGTDFEVGKDWDTTTANLKDALEKVGKDIKLVDAKGNDAGSVNSKMIFGDDKEIKIIAASSGSNELGFESTMKTKGGFESQITDISLENGPVTSVDVSLTNGLQQTSADSTVTFDEGVQYGSIIEVDGKQYELVKNADDLSDRSNIAVVVGDTSDSESVARAFADAVKGQIDTDKYKVSVASNKVTIGTKDIGSTTTAIAVGSSGDKTTQVEFTLDPSKMQAGSTVTINGQTYEFVKKGDKASNSTNTAIDVSSFAKETSVSLGKALANAANGKNNASVTVDKDGLVKVRGLVDEDNEIVTPSVKFDGGTNGLTLQIGDTADDFNKMKVSIYKMKCADMGIGDISILDQDSAGAAIDKIRAAINYVSDVRGTLGATQNRLDHTINNLSVMQENIQDAESTIRDTDVAAEMMAYTKNNILIQSAQAMLAQANQVPQGVLQLLQ